MPLLIAFLVTTGGLEVQQARQGPATYPISRTQLEAFEAMRSGRCSLIYSWQSKETKAFGGDVELTEKTIPKNRLPVLGLDGDAFYTTDRTLEAATKFEDLAFVQLAYCCRISDVGIQHLTKLKSIRVLVLYRNSGRFGGNLLPSEFMKEAKHWPARLTDKCIDHICEIEGLETLYLAHNEFTEDAVVKLGKIKTLKHLVIDDRQVSDRGLAKLREQLPNCKVVVWDGIAPLKPAKKDK